MTAVEWWLLAATVAAGLAALATLAAARTVDTPGHVALPLGRLGQALGHAAVGLIAVALLLALP